MDEIQRFTVLKEKTTKASESKIRLEERFKSEREKLEALIKDIQAKGYDPTKLAETKNAKTIELKTILDTYEKEVNELLQQLNGIEAATNA
jgi:hypothetical protein